MNNVDIPGSLTMAAIPIDKLNCGGKRISECCQKDLDADKSR